MPSGYPAVEVRDLTKSFGPVVALESVDLRVEAGEFVVIVGPNGAGKTTLLRVLTTLARPTSGKILIEGLDLARQGVILRRRIGFLSHRTLLYGDLTAEQNLAFYARLYALPDAPARIGELLERVGLTARRHDLVRTYSRGMQQRLAVARAVLHRPSLLLLDEPYTGLDPLAQESLTALLGELSTEGCTVLLTTHAPERVHLVGRRAVILDGGRLIDDAPVGDWDAFASRYRQIITGEHPAKRTSEERRQAIAPLPPQGPATPAAGKTDTEKPGAGLRQVWAIVRKDVAAEIHTREMVSAMFVFAVVALLIFSFALDLRGTTAQAAAPGVLWTTIVFAGTLGLSRSLAREEQTGAIEGLLLAPMERTVIFFGKALGNLLLMGVVELVLLPLGTALFDVFLLRADLALILLLGTLGYATVGTLLAAVAVNTRAREVMLPILLLPLVVPLLIGAVQGTAGLLAGATLGEVSSWLNLLVVYDLLMVAVSMLTFGYVVEG